MRLGASCRWDHGGLGVQWIYQARTRREGHLWCVSAYLGPLCVFVTNWT